MMVKVTQVLMVVVMVIIVVLAVSGTSSCVRDGNMTTTTSNTMKFK